MQMKQKNEGITEKETITIVKKEIEKKINNYACHFRKNTKQHSKYPEKHFINIQQNHHEVHKTNTKIKRNAINKLHTRMNEVETKKKKKRCSNC